MNWDKVERDIEKGPMGAFKWVVITVILFGLLFGAIRFVVTPGKMALDRIVTKHSFQYQEGMEQRAAILQANISEIEIMLQQNPENRQNLVAQKRLLRVQLNAITINQ